jgi:hypothetical protein
MSSIETFQKTHKFIECASEWKIEREISEKEVTPGPYFHRFI